MRFSELDGARIGVWGAGRELVSFAEQLGRRLPSAHIETIVLDGEPPRDVRERLGAPQARVLGAADAVAALGACEVVVRSPHSCQDNPDTIEEVRRILLLHLAEP